ncbi:hypothetical protein BIW11_10455 [Tropilaelaps mercedesae]|uniref:Uncharacterized protein n=1 Tax=Tropilaelaps mercedesae TaxID=418985 RepID=A0A1V9XFM7_9ACAR|nr:hypothetical protein BIW11_10455 [Tropilaelaps mercedesae]
MCESQSDGQEESAPTQTLADECCTAEVCQYLVLLIPAGILVTIIYMVLKSTGKYYPTEDNHDVRPTENASGTAPETANPRERRELDASVKGNLAQLWLINTNQTFSSPARESRATPADNDDSATEGKSFNISCDYDRKWTSMYSTTVTSTLWQVKDNIENNARRFRVHYKIEATLSVPYSFLRGKAFRGAYIAVMFAAIRTNLTFVYDYVDCSGPFQPIWIVENPIFRDGKIVYRSHRRKGPRNGQLVDYFICSNNDVGRRKNYIHHSRFKVKADLDITSRRLQLQTCRGGTNVCDVTYDDWVPISTAEVDFESITTVFLADWLGGYFPGFDLSGVATWCVLEDEEKNNKGH